MLETSNTRLFIHNFTLEWFQKHSSLHLSEQIPFQNSLYVMLTQGDFIAVKNLLLW